MDLAAIAAFVSAAEDRSFTAAAGALGMTASGVSKAVSRLEDELRIRLFNRSTRSISLTADGAALYERFKQILSDLEEAKISTLQAQSSPSGRLRVSMPRVFGRLRMILAIAAFLEKHPQISVDASITDRVVDVVEEGFDVVVRIGELPDNRMVARLLASTKFIVCGSPAYFLNSGRPKTPADLRGHACVQFISPQTRRLMDWTFLVENQPHVHSPVGALSVDSGEALVEAALCKSGLIYVQDYMAAGEIQAGKLETVLSEFSRPPTPIVALYPQNRHLSPKVRAFVDFMVGHFEKFEVPPATSRSLS